MFVIAFRARTADCWHRKSRSFEAIENESLKIGIYIYIFFCGYARSAEMLDLKYCFYYTVKINSKFNVLSRETNMADIEKCK